MKRPRPSAPSGLPLGTVRLGGDMEWFSAALHVTSDNLLPSEVTQLMRAEPTWSCIKGVQGINGKIGRFGRWSRILKPKNTDEWNAVEVMRLLFDGLPVEPSVWSSVAELGEIRVSRGLTAMHSSQEIFLETEFIQFLAARSVSVWMDVYKEDHVADT